MGEKLVLDQSNLLLDIGNTSIKYAWYTFPNHIADLQIMRTSLDSLEDLIESASSCWLCSVSDNNTNKRVKDICKNSGIPVYEAQTQASQFGITNAYSTHSNMGCDRWMAIIAGSALCDKGSLTNYIVVDAGTAITCDFVKGNQHLGGWIAPGLETARTAVVSQTKRVFDEQQVLSVLSLGKNTPQCVANGALAQLVGMLSQACSIMQTECTSFDVYISGGDAPMLINAFNEMNKKNVNINYLENIVLIGLAKLAHENTAKNA